MLSPQCATCSDRRVPACSSDFRAPGTAHSSFPSALSMSLALEYEACTLESTFSRIFWDSAMYFDTASFALSSVACAISRILSACSFSLSLIALSRLQWVIVILACWRRGSLRRLGDRLQFLSEFIDQHAGVLAVVDRNNDQVHPAALECAFERRDQVAGAFDP
jgi:hypothetical protein